MRFRALLLGILVPAESSVLATGCNGSSISPPAGDDGGITDAERLDGYPLHPAAPCLVTVDAPPLLPGLHVPIDTPVDYDSNPPSSGPHYPIWAAYQTYTTPVDRRYYVHNEEHGAVVLLYRCDDAADCPAYAAGLQAVVSSLPDDQACLAAGG